MRFLIACICMVSFLFLSAESCEEKNELMKCILDKTWVHSHEDDQNGIKAFRPEGYNFPPSRGRVSFKAYPNGNFDKSDIAATDGLDAKKGTWKLDEQTKKIMVTIAPNAKSSARHLEYEIISCDGELLKVKEKYID